MPRAYKQVVLTRRFTQCEYIYIVRYVLYGSDVYMYTYAARQRYLFILPYRWKTALSAFFRKLGFLYGPIRKKVLYLMVKN